LRFVFAVSVNEVFCIAFILIQPIKGYTTTRTDNSSTFCNINISVRDNWALPKWVHGKQFWGRALVGETGVFFNCVWEIKLFEKPEDTLGAGVVEVVKN
jgi:hypothetical protein